MKITYLYQYFNTPQMPGGTRAYEMGRRLVDAGHEVQLITSLRSGDPNSGWNVTNEAGMTVHWYPVPYDNKMSFRERVAAFFKFALACRKKAASIEADVVFATSTPLTIAIPGVHAAKKNRIPFVFEVRDLWPEMPIAIGALKSPFLIKAARQLENYAYKNAQRIVALSPGMAEGVEKAGIPKETIDVIPNSSDLELFQVSPEAKKDFIEEYPEFKKGPVILYAGTLGKINAADYLVKLAAELKKSGSNIQVVVFGEGADFDSMQDLAQELGVKGDNYFQYRRIPKASIPAAFAAASLVTSVICDLPEAEKNSANKFFDGLAAGRPVGINHGGWQAELLLKSNAGLVLDRKPQIAAEQAIDFFSDPARVENAGAAAIELARNEFSRDKLAAKLEQVLQQAIKDYHS